MSDSYGHPSSSHHDQTRHLPSERLDLKPCLDSLALCASCSAAAGSDGGSLAFADDDNHREPQRKPELRDDRSVTFSGSPAAHPVPDQDRPHVPSLIPKPFKKEDPFSAAQADHGTLKGASMVNEARPGPSRKRSRAPSIDDFDQVKREEEEEEARLQTLLPESSAATASVSEQQRGDSAAPFRRLKEYRRMEDQARVHAHNRAFGGVEEEQERLPDRDLDMQYLTVISTLFNEEGGGSTSPRGNSMDESTPEVSDEEDDEDGGGGGAYYKEEACHPSKQARIVKPAPRRRKASKGKRPAKAKPADEADAFPDTIKLPEPTPISTKLRLTNQLAHATNFFPPPYRVKPIETTYRPSPAVRDDNPDEPMEDLVDPAAPGGPSQPAAYAGLARPPSPADSLEEYDDLQDPPEGPFGVEEEVELAEEQAYWKNPTREGAITRWAMVLHKDSVPLDDALSWETFASDLSSLRNLSFSTSHADVTLPRNFQTVAAGPLLTHRPSSATCTQLWSDVLDASHAGRHAQTPRNCWCPLWVPAKRRSWENELKEIAKEKLKVDDLEEVVERVFEKKREEGLVQFAHEMNWLWFDQIFQLARIKQAYRRLASEDLVVDLARMITRLGAEHRRALVSTQENLERAEREGASAQAVNDVNVEVELMKSAWAVKEHDLKALEKRLLQRLEESKRTAKGPTQVAA
ncbi:hypothetical protein JCM21900_001069 [Sporobolomyces salmonicolor]